MPARGVEWDVAGERGEPGSLLTRLQQSESTLLQLSERLGQGDAEARVLASTLRQESESLGGLRGQLQTLLASWALVSELSNRLLNLPLDEIEPGLRAALAVLGTHSASQRAYVFLLSEDGNLLADAYEWCAEGVVPHDLDGFRGVPVTTFPWSMRRFLAGETVIVKDSALLPPEASFEKRACETLAIRAYVNMPLFLGGRLLGWMGFDAVEAPRVWPEESLRLMALSGDMLVNVLQRKRRDELILREKERLAKAEAELAASNVRLSESLMQLQAAQSQLLFADRLATIGQLAAGVVHEINNPLAFLLNNLAIAQRVLSQAPPASSPGTWQGVARALAEASEGAEQVHLIVRDLKMLSRPEQMECGPVELAKVLRSAAKLAAHEIRLRAHLVEEVDGVPPVHGDSTRLCQVFLNLLLNAAHAISPGQVERNRIQLMARALEGRRVLVEVSDTGCGIPPELLERVFDPFVTTKPVEVGSGLGLSVCQRIIAAHGGEISVESQLGRGTTFRVLLPVHISGDSPAPGPEVLYLEDPGGARTPPDS